MADEKNSKFLDKSKWSLIKNGWVFEAAVPYVGERPLDFFIPDVKSPFRGKVVRGTSVSLTEDFTTGGNKEYQVVLQLKPRKVLVLSNNELNEDLDHYDVIVAKIYQVHPDDKLSAWYELAKNGNHPFFFWLDKDITGRECVIDLSSVTTIHKNMLLEEKMDLSPIMPAVDQKIKYCFDLGMEKVRDLDTGEEVS